MYGYTKYMLLCTYNVFDLQKPWRWRALCYVNTMNFVRRSKYAFLFIQKLGYPRNDYVSTFLELQKF